MAKSEDKLLQIRKRLYEDFEFWAKNCAKIRTKEGEVKPLVLNGVQKRFVATINRQLKETGKVRLIVLKARQQGLSTVISAWMYWWLSQHKAQKGIVIAHQSDSTKTLFDMYKRLHENCPEPVKPSTRYSSRRELVFDKLDTALQVATAGGEGIGRGETLTHAHLSEAAFYPSATAADNLNAVFQAIPNTPGTAIFIESTANGMSGPFYDLWKGCVDGTNGFEGFFSAWYETPEYQEPVDKDFELSPEEEDLVKDRGLTKPQLLYRRRKIAQNGRDAFFQEYPSNADEAFIASGRPVFNPDLIHTMLQKAPEPIQRLALEGEEWHENARGELLIYKKHKVTSTYYIGADVAMGIKGGDWSVAQVLNEDKEQVAVWRAHVHPDYFAEVLVALGRHFNDALIAVENNGHGLLTAVKLRDSGYPNIYTEVTEGNLSDRDTIRIGFRTTVKTKPLIIDRLRASLREQDIEIYDKTTLREMLSYVVTESGNMEAEEGCYDDCVMSLALCNHIHEGRFKPVEVSDEFYVNAI
jgi:hypothetical protein